MGGAVAQPWGEWAPREGLHRWRESPLKGGAPRHARAPTWQVVGARAGEQVVWEARAPAWQVAGVRASEQVAGPARRPVDRAPPPGAEGGDRLASAPFREGDRQGVGEVRAAGGRCPRARLVWLSAPVGARSAAPPRRSPGRATAAMSRPAGGQRGMDRFEGARPGAPLRGRGARIGRRKYWFTPTSQCPSEGNPSIDLGRSRGGRSSVQAYPAGPKLLTNSSIYPASTCDRNPARRPGPSPPLHEEASHGIRS